MHDDDNLPKHPEHGPLKQTYFHMEDSICEDGVVVAKTDVFGDDYHSVDGHIIEFIGPGAKELALVFVNRMNRGDDFISLANALSFSSP